MQLTDKEVVGNSINHELGVHHIYGYSCLQYFLFFQQVSSFCIQRDCSECVLHVADFGDRMLCTCLWRDSIRMEPMVFVTLEWFLHHSSSSGY